MDYETIWKQVLDVIRISVSPANFQTWFSQTIVVNSRPSGERIIIEIGCPSSFIRDTLENRYSGLLQDAVNQVTGKQHDMVFIVKQNNVVAKLPSSPLFDQNDDVIHAKLFKNAGIPEGFAFDNFAVSGSNQLAWAAAEAVAKNPGKMYNPLFLWGGVGVGKTHLAIATAREIVKRFNNKKVLYVTGDEFIVEIIDAIRTKTTPEFKRKYRPVDVLIVDDIQFIAGKDTVQNEFFHTFNVIQRAGGQIILTSDRPPAEILKLEDRLQSRFEAGLIVDIEPPDFELRVAILLIKSKEKGIIITPDIAQKVASIITGARQIEGFIVRLLSRTTHQNHELTEELVNELLNLNRDVNNSGAHANPSTYQFRPRITTRDVIEAACEYFSLTKKNLINGGRKRTLVIPRHILMYLLRIELKLPYDEIGRVLGGKDHTTIMHGVEKITQDINTNGDIREHILGIKKHLWG